MTDREKAIVMAYTGETMLTGEKIFTFLDYVTELMERKTFVPVNQNIYEEIRRRAWKDFMELGKEEI